MASISPGQTTISIVGKVDFQVQIPRAVDYRVLCRAKNRKKYTSIFGRFSVPEMKKGPRCSLFDRSEAPIYSYSAYFSLNLPLNREKPRFCLGRQKWGLLCIRATKRYIFKLKKRKRYRFYRFLGSFSSVLFSSTSTGMKVSTGSRKPTS